VTEAAATADAADSTDSKPAKKATKKSAAKKSAPKKSAARATGKKAAKTAAKKVQADAAPARVELDTGTDAPAMASAPADHDETQAERPSEGPAFAPLFQAPEVTARATSGTSGRDTGDESQGDTGKDSDGRGSEVGEGEGSGSNRRRRSRGGRNRRKSSDAEQQKSDTDGTSEAKDGAGDREGKADQGEKAGKSSRGKSSRSKEKGDKDKSGDKDKAAGSAEAPAADADAGEGTTSSRRRRRRSRGDDSVESGDKDAKARSGKADKDSISGVEGSTRIEAKKQRRREGREAGRRRAPILSESEFLARRESVDRVMAIRQRGETTQIAVLEDGVLVEHYVALESQGSMIGNVYLGKVQNVLPSMEAAFIDIGRGRNAVLYAGEVNWDLVPDKNAPRRIENALKPGQAVLVQVTKDPIGHKGARLTAQVSLPGRYLVYVPGGGTSGISRKLPDTERNRLKNLLMEILPEDAGVIIRTAAEGASEEALTRDVNRLTARWEDIDKKVKAGQAPSLLYAEPDTTLKVVRDLFTEDFSKLVISGDDAWDMVDGYVQHVAPDLAERLERYEGDGDVFAGRRIDEQITKALERKVWLPSGGSLVIDRTEAMTVIDVNTGKFTGAGGNLEETVTKNNLEAAEEIVRQLRLRDVGGIIVIDFIDMVLESNRDLVLRRLVECLGRDRTRHQVAEVTSLGLVQMTRKRISTGLLEAFSHSCDQCQGRGVIIESEPIEPKQQQEDAGSSKRGSSSRRSSSRRRGGKSGKDSTTEGGKAAADGVADAASAGEADTGTASEQESSAAS
jgi:ribonuclease E